MKKNDSAQQAVTCKLLTVCLCTTVLVFHAASSVAFVINLAYGTTGLTDYVATVLYVCGCTKSPYPTRHCRVPVKPWTFPTGKVCGVTGLEGWMNMSERNAQVRNSRPRHVSNRRLAGGQCKSRRAHS